MGRNFNHHIAEGKEQKDMAKKDYTESIKRTATLHSAIAEAIEEPEEQAAQPAQEVQEAQETQDAQQKPKAQKKPRRRATEEEVQEALLTMNTRGRGGAKLPRINMAFAADVYDYIRVMAPANGRTMGAFVNDVLRLSMKNNMEMYLEILKHRKDLK